jgi:YHS domain-containing protein
MRGDLMSTLHYQSTRGVYYDITHSHFKCEVKDLTFYFTSEYNLSRFEDRYLDEIHLFRKKIESIYWNNHSLHFDELALIRLYQRIEKRGFLIYYKGKRIECPQDIVFKTELETV